MKNHYASNPYCLPPCFINDIFNASGASGGTHQSVVEIIFNVHDDTNATNPVSGADKFTWRNMFQNEDGQDPADLEVASGYNIFETIESFPHIKQIEDETDLTWILCQVTCLKQHLLRARHTGERENRSIQNTLENANKNIGYFTNVLNELTAIPDDKVLQKQLENLEAKQQLLVDLEAKYTTYNPYFCN